MRWLASLASQPIQQTQQHHCHDPWCLQPGLEHILWKFQHRFIELDDGKILTGKPDQFDGKNHGFRLRFSPTNQSNDRWLRIEDSTSLYSNVCVALLCILQMLCRQPWVPGEGPVPRPSLRILQVLPRGPTALRPPTTQGGHLGTAEVHISCRILGGGARLWKDDSEVSGWIWLVVSKMGFSKEEVPSGRGYSIHNWFLQSIIFFYNPELKYNVQTSI